MIASQPVFDVADEYTELLYRQFVVLLGTAVVPLITVLAVVSFFTEYDRSRLRRSGVPSGLVDYCEREPVAWRHFVAARAGTGLTSSGWCTFASSRGRRRVASARAS